MSLILGGCINLPPVADAGPDHQTLTGRVVLLDGSNSIDPDGDRLTYRWELVDSKKCSPATSENSVLSVVCNSEGDYRYRLTVTDRMGQSDSDTTLINVRSGLIDILGPDSIRLGQRASFVATLLYPEKEHTFRWYLNSIPENDEPLWGFEGSNFFIVPDVPHAEYEVGVDANDSIGIIATKLKKLSVENSNPQIILQDQTIYTVPGHEITINVDVEDPDSDPVDIAWDVEDAPSQDYTLETDGKVARLKTSPDVSGIYTIKITAKDSYGGIDTKNVTIVADIKSEQIDLEYPESINYHCYPEDLLCEAYITVGVDPEGIVDGISLDLIDPQNQADIVTDVVDDSFFSFRIVVPYGSRLSGDYSIEVVITTPWQKNYTKVINTQILSEAPELQLPWQILVQHRYFGNKYSVEIDLDKELSHPFFEDPENNAVTGEWRVESPLVPEVSKEGQWPFQKIIVSSSNSNLINDGFILYIDLVDPDGNQEGAGIIIVPTNSPPVFLDEHLDIVEGGPSVCMTDSSGSIYALGRLRLSYRFLPYDPDGDPLTYYSVIEKIYGNNTKNTFTLDSETVSLSQTSNKKDITSGLTQTSELKVEASHMVHDCLDNYTEGVYKERIVWEHFIKDPFLDTPVESVSDIEVGSCHGACY